EGLVLKDLKSSYQLGEKSRHSGSWVKMKPEYSDQTSDMDLLILAAKHGDGPSRAGVLSSFIMGV
ncbi:unnamed protein product, partial [Discosporangium mesarthrocarpum]